MAANAATIRPSGAAPVNPERLPQLMGKWAKYIGKSIATLRIEFTSDGVTVGIDGMPDTAYASLKDASVAEFKKIREEEAKPSDTEALQSFKNKFELRLNREFPSGELTSGEPAAIQAFLNGLPFRERRALMMTSKQFEASYPNGFTQA